MCVDGICAFAMVGYFRNGDNWYLSILLYNFCAFALQMPFGFVLDYLEKEYHNKYIPFGVTAVGVCLTVLGAWTHPVVLGVGNALFHIGGGVCTIREDLASGRKGRMLGVFVAPGAFGLFVGKKYGYLFSVLNAGIICGAIVALVGLLVVLFAAYRHEDFVQTAISTKMDTVVNSSRNKIPVLLLCFLVVVIRSHVTMSMTFDWNTGFVYSLLLVLAAVFGKMSGGLAASIFPKEIAIAVSLGLAAAGFIGGALPVMGILAVFFFNMTMPMTLYELAVTFEGLEGGMFGILTFALFLGFIPTYLAGAPSGNTPAGALASVASVILLLTAVRLGKREVCK